MGSSNSVCININLDRPNPFYFGGETVSGTVRVEIKESQIKMDEIFVVLQGETGYTTQRTVHENGSSRTETDYHSISFLKNKQVLDAPKSSGNALHYQAGNYAWPFAFVLPDHLPPSANDPKKYPHVRYYLKLVIDKPWYKRNTTETLYLTVYPRMDLARFPQCLVSTIFGNQNRKDVCLKGTIDKLGYVPGEAITGILQLENSRGVLVKSVQVKLKQYNQIECNSRKETIFETVMPSFEHRRDQLVSEKFSFPIPMIPLPPSYEFHEGYDRTTNMTLTYQLEFHLKVEGMFTDFDVSIPITLGTAMNGHVNQMQERGINTFGSNFIRYYPEINGNDYVEPPPSYYAATR